jgi:hypothetical protein
VLDYGIRQHAVAHPDRADAGTALTLAGADGSCTGGNTVD